MQEFDSTTRFAGAAMPPDGSLVTIFDGTALPRTIHLGSFGKPVLYFGRDPQNDIVLTSRLVSAQHGRFIYQNNMWIMQDKAVYQQQGSTNGLIHNNASIIARAVADGDFIRIDDGVETVANGVLFVFSSSDSNNKWESMPTQGRAMLTIGRDPSCDIVLPHVTVSKCHAKIVAEPDGYYIIDNNSTNGIIVNNERISGRQKLHEKDVIAITSSKLIFTSHTISYCCYKSGITVDASDIVITRGKGRKSFITCNHADLSIKPGELVAIVGGSGAGKSTILNCMCGYLKPTSGEVYINGIDLYQHFDSIKKMIGYVPQSDIVYDNLTLHDMLMYTAKLRLPSDTTPAEREAAISRAISTVDLDEKRGSFIKALSGGQRKRASIAVELLSDPNLLFLDEPASGLDPGTEQSLMQSLRQMADNGKTVILVTHSTLQLQMCDKIVFMGKGGNLSFCGPYDEALQFFGVDNVIDIYKTITDHAVEWATRYKQTYPAVTKTKKDVRVSPKKHESRLKQLGVLSTRYIKLVTNDTQRLLLLMVQAPLLALLISLVADDNQFTQYEMTKSLLFALSCSAFWVGMLNAIQEICKERTILKREFMTGLSLSSYISSKIIVLGLMCMIQSLMITGVFAALVGLPDEGLFLPPFLELLITTFLTAVASTAMGLFVSSLFTNADRAMTVAPILLMPQILFSGMIFKLEGATESISWLAICRFSMEGFGTTANLNDLTLKLEQEGIDVTMPNGVEQTITEFPPRAAEDYYSYELEHLLFAWGMLLAYTVVCLILARLVLSKIGKEKS